MTWYGKRRKGELEEFNDYQDGEMEDLEDVIELEDLEIYLKDEYENLDKNSKII